MRCANCPPPPRCPPATCSRTSGKQPGSMLISLTAMKVGLGEGPARGPARQQSFQFSSSGGSFWNYFTLHSQLSCPDLLFSLIFWSRFDQQGLAYWLTSETEMNSREADISCICHFLSVLFFITLIQGTFQVPLLPFADVFSS